MKLTVILPILEIGNDLDECINSIENQTINDIELIISCNKNIEKQLKEKYKCKTISSDSDRIEILRNNAIKQAKGEYISIINDKMILNPKMYENVLFQQSDICICCYKENKKVIKIEPFSKQSSIIKIDDNIYNKVFKKSFVINNHFTFNNCISDKLFIYKVVATANTFGFVHDVCYVTSLVYKSENDERIYRTIDEIIKYYKIKKIYEKNKSKLEYVFVNEILKTANYLKKDKKHLENNWNYLNEKFPNWKKNLYVKRMPGIKGLRLRITNKFIYNIRTL